MGAGAARMADAEKKDVEREKMRIFLRMKKTITINNPRESHNTQNSFVHISPEIRAFV